ncbi:MAG: acetolactate synthase small subunit [Sphaerochaetaceae bacterium]|jgi:acetolactate synthase-1/3 small subunit|nr:acetolactate synthase small subunit [Sphaerochaetaceae bacterium]NLO59470.1 acetolactate synthase small subunit [Spirochaetales bacterium]MDD2405255.1 acetolactate synthase small subunit [Sphaerochaetaceae bacterium]MDD3670592.1 acetolactate synthase small subunit [Sphaerochaetaceae bacterium]MDD4259141.1 acetolactate synthase small subunit [Sphaerochaetaceae bacterium]
MERYTLGILVNNHPGVLSRVVGLFSRRGYNIDSLSVGETEIPTISRITIVVTGDRQIVEQIEKQVAKLIDVINVVELSHQGSIQAELILVKLSTENGNRAAVIQLSEIFKAKIVDVSEATISLQLTGNLDKINSFLRLSRPYGICELVRTGITAMGRDSQAKGDASPDDSEY